MDRIGSLAVLLLEGVVGVAVVAITAAVLVTLRDLRRTLREAHGTFAQARQLLTRANATTHQVTTVVEQVCALTTGMMDSVTAWTTRARRALSRRLDGRHGNGNQASSTHVS